MPCQRSTLCKHILDLGRCHCFNSQLLVVYMCNNNQYPNLSFRLVLPSPFCPCGGFHSPCCIVTDTSCMSSSSNLLLLPAKAAKSAVTCMPTICCQMCAHTEEALHAGKAFQKGGDEILGSNLLPDVPAMGACVELCFTQQCRWGFVNMTHILKVVVITGMQHGTNKAGAESTVPRRISWAAITYEMPYYARTRTGITQGNEL